MSEMKKRGRKGVLSVEIDLLLCEGGRRVSQIADVLVERLGEKYTKPQIVNNVRSRILVLTQKGYTLEKTADKHVRLVAPEPTAAV